MIIRFRVENFLSFNDRVEFSMFPGVGKSKPEHIVRTIEENGRNDVPTLKLGAIFGANASGKTNLLKAIGFMRYMILEEDSTRKEIKAPYFKLNKDSENKPTRFEIEIRVSSKFYAYGFVIKNRKIDEEWLYEINKNKDTLIYNRKTSDGSKKAEIEFGTNEIDEISYVANVVDTQLILTLFKFITYPDKEKKSKYQSFFDVLDWFIKRLFIIYPSSKYGGSEYLYSDKDSGIIEEFSKVLLEFDTGIHSLCHEEINDLKKDIGLPEKIVDDILEKIENNGSTHLVISDKHYTIINKEGKLKYFKLKSQHEARGINKLISFDLNEESDGSRRLIDLLPLFMKAQESDTVIMIDELDRSLHTLAARKFIEFLLTIISKNQSQLIVTTHDSNLLDLELFRKDEIWFVDKNKYGESSLYSLEEFKVRSDKKVEKGYLLGRYGAVPNFSRVKHG